MNDHEHNKPVADSVGEPPREGAAEIAEDLRAYWDRDAATYDQSLEHAAQTSAQRAAWAATLRRLLPDPPARVLDVGAGTGFLSLPLARLGFEVTALDISTGMLEHLRRKAAAEGLTIDVVEGSATDPPPGPFDVIVERLMLWTLLQPPVALAAWREVAPGGHLVSIGAVWGRVDPAEAARARLRRLVRRVRRDPPEHHAPYPASFTSLPKENRADPQYVVSAVESAGWENARLERLWDVEWALTLARPLPLRLLGATPEFAVLADAPRS